MKNEIEVAVSEVEFRDDLYPRIDTDPKLVEKILQPPAVRIIRANKKLGHGEIPIPWAQMGALRSAEFQIKPLTSMV